MQMNDSTRLKVTENLLALERGGDELNAHRLRQSPAALRKEKGRKPYIKRFLKAIPELKSYGNITKVFPEEADLLDTLLHHGIVVPHEFKRSRMQQYSPERPRSP